MFYFPVKRALKIDQLQTAANWNAGQFADALLQLLTFDPFGGQFWLVKIKI